MGTPSAQERERAITWRVPVPCSCVAHIDGNEDVIIVALSPRESDAARCLTRGLSNKEISAEMGITVSSVKNHITSINAKLSVTNRTAAALMLVRRGVTVVTLDAGRASIFVAHSADPELASQGATEAEAVANYAEALALLNDPA